MISYVRQNLTSKRDTNAMNLTPLTEKIKSVFDAGRLLNLAKQCKFLLGSRQTIPMTLLLSFIETLGSQSKANIADIHRKYQTLSDMPKMYPLSNEYKGVRKYVFSKQTSIYYRISGSYLEIIAIRLNQKDPSTFKL